ncbi:protein-L-isoaspartate(D-aspartate) O-methyltransferase [Nocardiopsis flavescens]|uniref:protein-L-isoaspartate(D-aspartate) O-methyltransferase n=1 Tax=Nocardiopsis flavescens TaxID=758803 RepID=UPI003652FEB2
MTGQNEDMPLDYSPIALQLVDALLDQGTPAHIANAFARVPRHRFLPRVFWGEDRTRYDRDTDPAAWLAAAYTDQPLVTQIDDGSAGGMDVPTSSSSAPSVMARMLTAADLRHGHTVLEVGTGTGYNAAVLCELLHRAGVISIDIDKSLVDTATANLHTCGYRPAVLPRDGEAPGLAPGAVHRLIATCTVSDVPWQWLEVAGPDGRIVTPWAPTPGAPGGVLAVLDIDSGGGRASGRFEGGLSFMWARGQRRPSRPAPSPDALAEHTLQAADDPRADWLDGERALLLSLLVPGWSFGMGMDEGVVEPHVWIGSTSCSSWLRLHVDGRVESAGPRRLWAEFTDALVWWRAQGEPDLSDFGLTVDRGRALQRVWLGNPDTPVWTAHRTPA